MLQPGGQGGFDNRETAGLPLACCCWLGTRPPAEVGAADWAYTGRCSSAGVHPSGPSSAKQQLLHATTARPLLLNRLIHPRSAPTQRFAAAPLTPGCPGSS